MDFTKHKRIRLKGKDVAELNEVIHERDHYRCIMPECRNYVPLQEKWHHEPCGSNKEDIVEKGCLLCYEHHQQREGPQGNSIKQACNDYLNGLYPLRR